MKERVTRTRGLPGRSRRRRVPEKKGLIMKHKGFLILGVAAVLVSGCANPSINTHKSAYFREHTPKRILVTRFEGNPAFVDESTDYFVSFLESQTDVAVIQSDSLRAEGVDILAGGNIAPLDLGLVEARNKKADLLVLGKVTSHQTAGSLNGFCTIRVYDAVSGDRVATFHRPSGLMFGWSEHQCVMKAVKRASKDFQKILDR
jgi:hypothetical protein